jgi:hypothetical protein
MTGSRRRRRSVKSSGSLRANQASARPQFLWPRVGTGGAWRKDSRQLPAWQSKPLSVLQNFHATAKSAP